jgi:hypothetical protein
VRSILVKGLLLAVAVLGAVSPVAACGCGMIKIPGTIVHSVPRDNHILCLNDQDHILVLDLVFTQCFDLGPAEGRRWDGDVADGQALLLSGNCLHVVDLVGGRTAHEVAVGDGIRAYGFAGKGRAFLHYGLTVAVVDLTTGETLNTIGLSEDGWSRARPSPWQKVGDRLFVVGPNGTLCVVDLAAGKLTDKFQVESRAGVANLCVSGDMAYCIGSPFSWGATIDHLTCINLKTKRITECELPRTASRNNRLAPGPNGTVYLTDRNEVDRYDRSGPRVGTWVPKLGEGVQLLAVWELDGVVAMKGVVMFLPVTETAVAAK